MPTDAFGQQPYNPEISQAFSFPSPAGSLASTPPRKESDKPLWFLYQNCSLIDRGFLCLGSYSSENRQPIRKVTLWLVAKYLLVAVLFFLLHGAADLASGQLTIGYQISPWYLGAGVDLLCSLILGPMAYPILLMTEMTSTLLTFPLSIPRNLIPGFVVVKELLYVLEGSFLLRKVCIDLHFRSARALTLLLVTAFVVHPIIGIIYMSFVHACCGTVTYSLTFQFILGWALGDIIGIVHIAVVVLMVMPYVVTVVRTLRTLRPSDIACSLRTFRTTFVDLFLHYLPDIVCLGGCYALWLWLTPHPLFICFFPVPFTVIRHGIKASPIFLLINMVVISNAQTLQRNTLDVQLFLLASAICALYVGITLSQKDAYQDRLHIRTEQLLSEQKRMNILQQRLLANVSHEIRTPLYGIFGMLELCMEEGMPSAELHENLSHALHSGRILIHLLNDLIDYHKLVDGKLNIVNRPYNLHEVVKSVITLFMPQFTKKGLRCELFLDENTVPITVLGDEVRVAQILTNLVANAMKFTHVGGVTVNIRHDGDKQLLSLEVSDTGVGIDAHHLETIFDPFTQVDGSTTRAFHGAGLGLSVVKELVTMMGGEVSVNSTKDVGSTFLVQLPCCPLPSEPSISPKHPKQEPNISSRPSLVPKSEPPWVLVVEDNPVVAKITTHFLNDVCRCDVAENGQVALDMVTQKPYSLLLMDMHMPLLDGLEATARIRQLPAPEFASLERTLDFSTIPIIGLTASCFEEDVARCLAAGMNDVLNKPVTKHVLVSRVLTAIEDYNRCHHLVNGKVQEPQESVSVSPKNIGEDQNNGIEQEVPNRKEIEESHSSFGLRNPLVVPSSSSSLDTVCVPLKLVHASSSATPPGGSTSPKNAIRQLLRESSVKRNSWILR